MRTTPDAVTRVRHPVFARVYERVAAAAEKAGASAHRDALLADLSGRVVELGAGTGLNFGPYPTTGSQGAAVEPERHLPAKAAQTAAHPAGRIPLTARTPHHTP